MKRYYKVINCIIMITVMFLYILLFGNIVDKSGSDKFWHVNVLSLTAFLVLILKALRMYIILYGDNITFMQHMIQYCKVLPASIILPFKTGELFRMFCYGYEMQNYVSGIVCILLDRFMDTLALVTVMLCFGLVYKIAFSVIFYILCIFLICIFCAYKILPELCIFWKRYFINSLASRRKIKVLFFLEKLQNAYIKILTAIRGKFIILYILSLFAWCVELGGLLFINYISKGMEIKDILSIYLISALNGTEFEYMQWFSLVSITLLIIGYLVLRVVNVFKFYSWRRK